MFDTQTVHPAVMRHFFTIFQAAVCTGLVVFGVTGIFHKYPKLSCPMFTKQDNHFAATPLVPSNTSTPLTVTRQYMPEMEPDALQRISAFLKHNRCEDLYLDMGTNIGVQPRKAYEPGVYSLADPLIMKKFDSFFGTIETSRRRALCTVGFEPNTAHTSQLLKVQRHLRECYNASVMFLTNTGVGGRTGTLTFRTDDMPEKNFWGAHVEDASDMHSGPHGQVQGTAVVLDLAVIMRTIKNYGGIRHLHIKSDIEGSEYAAFGSALLKGQMCTAAQNTSLVLETHTTRLLEKINVSGEKYMVTLFALLRQSAGCSIDFTFHDDESYLTDVPILCKTQ